MCCDARAGKKRRRKKVVFGNLCCAHHLLSGLSRGLVGTAHPCMLRVIRYFELWQEMFGWFGGWPPTEPRRRRDRPTLGPSARFDHREFLGSAPRHDRIAAGIGWHGQTRLSVDFGPSVLHVVAICSLLPGSSAFPSSGGWRGRTRERSATGPPSQSRHRSR